VKAHSAAWDDEVDLAGKNVAVIGNGGSAIQIIPKLQKIVKRLDAYARGSTWISPRSQGLKLRKLILEEEIVIALHFIIADYSYVR
jgi:cation diffusion facilitator CzcD-associated flavoprotein CzcO